MKRQGLRGGRNMFRRCNKVVALCAGVTMIAAASTAAVVAQTYPAQPIKVIVGFGPGSAADILAPLDGKQLELGLRQPLVLEYRPANSRTIAAGATSPA